MNRIVWRWGEKDLGFRFCSGKGKGASELYQARSSSEFYVVPGSQRKLSKDRVEQLAALFPDPSSTKVVANPWRNYEHDWDWVITDDGICLNWAGCLDQEEIYRREDEGVQRAREMVAALVTRTEAVPLTVGLIQRIHIELMGDIYPFAGKWRTVALHKGDGPTKWPLPPGGIQPLIDVFDRDVLSRSPIISEEDEKVFAYASEVMNELLAIHPFREGNGRTAFIVGDLILMQNEMLPLTTYERLIDEARYLAACESGRIQKDYEPLGRLLAEWEEKVFEEWKGLHG